MKIRQDSSGRVQPIEYRNLASPAQCLLCNRIGHSPDEIFATLGVELEFYGIAYLCTDCCNEIANFVGAVDSERYDEMVSAADQMFDNWMNALKQVDTLRGILNGRIDLAVLGEPLGDGDDGLPVSEDERASAKTS